MKTKVIIGIILRTISPLCLGAVAGRTIKIFGPDITWNVIAMCVLSFGMSLGWLLSRD